ncbi:zinc/iron transporter, putative, partial [Ricinus communis]
MSTFDKILRLISIFFIILSIFTSQSLSESDEKCETEEKECHDKTKALPLKIIAIASILVTSMIGVCCPLLTRSIPAPNPERNIFFIIKGFAAGIILATGFVHVLPDAFDMLSKSCLKDPWDDFPFAGFVSMLSSTLALMIIVYTARNAVSRQAQKEKLFRKIERW